MFVAIVKEKIIMFSTLRTLLLNVSGTARWALCTHKKSESTPSIPFIPG